MERRFMTPASRSFVRFTLATILFYVWGTMPGRTAPVSGQIVRGQVVDSLSGAPISGGSVILLDVSGSETQRTLTDTEGLFLIRAPSSGTYTLRVEAESFLASNFPAFALALDQMEAFRLLVSSERPPAVAVDPAVVQLLESACGADFVPDQPVILGQVLAPGSLEPVDAAEVVMTWPTVPDFLQAHAGYENATGAAATGSTGFYAICGAPVGTDIVIHAESQRAVSELVKLRFENNGVFVGDSFLAMTIPIWRQDFTLYSGGEMTGSIRGIVVDTSGARVANARITVVSTNFMTRANLVGDFNLTGLPPGTVRLSVEQVGYRQMQTDVLLEPGQALTLPSTAFAMVRAPVALDPIAVTAERPERRRTLAEFEKRRATTTGSFMTREEWTRLGVVDETVDVLRRLRGLRIVRGPDLTQPWLITSSRGGGRGSFNSTLTGGACFPLVFLDRRYLGNTSQISVERSMNLMDLEAVEYHSSTAGMPAEFNRTGAVCGVLVFWTR